MISYSATEKRLIEYCLYFAEKLQECIDTKKHPFGSGNVIKDVLLSFDDFYKENLEDYTITELTLMEDNK